jgi:hypothetical protein
LVDGLRPDVAEGLLEDGRLPHLTAMVQGGGGGVTRAVSSFPSTTSVSYLPFFTGCTPGRCNIPSIRWLDRATYGGKWWRNRNAVRSYCGYQAGMLDDDIDPSVRTVFELVPESVAFFTMITRGLTPERDPGRRARVYWAAVGHYAYWHQPSDDVVARHLLRAVDQPWKFCFAQFPAVDGYTHQSTPQAPTVLRALERVDTVVGRLRDRLAVRGELEESLILVVSDHGATEVHTHLDLPEWFRNRGVPTLSHPIMWQRAPRAAVMVAGNGSAMVYARPTEPRTNRWPLERLRHPDAFGSDHDLIDPLVADPAVAFVAGETGGGAIRVVSSSGEAEIRWRDDAISYQPMTGDPLDIGAARTLAHREWLEQTWNGSFPDAPVQLVDQFRSPRTGDLVVVGREGFDFRRRYEIPLHKAGHGSMHRAHMQIPLWSSHPLPAQRLRSTDLFPSMLAWLGVEVPAEVDGELVWHPGQGPGHGRGHREVSPVSVVAAARP